MRLLVTLCVVAFAAAALAVSLAAPTAARAGTHQSRSALDVPPGPTVRGWSSTSPEAFGPDVLPCCGGGGYTNYSDVVAYAKQYALNYNGAYVSFSNDCQNFVSQALTAGGWKNDPSDVYDRNGVDDHQWWYGSGPPGSGVHWTYSWENTVDFQQYVELSGRGTFVSYWSQAIPGDIVQVNWTGGTEPDHSMIITATGATLDDIKITQHTTNRLNYPLIDDMNSYPKATWWLIQPY